MKTQGEVAILYAIMSFRSRSRECEQTSKRNNIVVAEAGFNEMSRRIPRILCRSMNMQRCDVVNSSSIETIPIPTPMVFCKLVKVSLLTRWFK